MTFEEKKQYLAKIAKHHTYNHEGWLCAELEKAWAALEFYADPYKHCHTCDRSTVEIVDDCKLLCEGKRAREVLDE